MFFLLPSSRRRAVSTLAFAALLVAPSALYAQQSLGTISGTIADGTGAIVPGSIATIVNQETAATRTIRSNGSGGYSFQALPIGAFTGGAYKFQADQANGNLDGL